MPSSKRLRQDGELASDKKSKKSKSVDHHDEPTSDLPVEGSSEVKTEEVKEPKKPKKSKKDKKDKNEMKPTSSLPPQMNASEIPSTVEDSSSSEPTLSAQAVKALEYAKTIGTPTFKFAKAKQGWLMRNVFSETEVPESYLDSVLAYLKTAKGGSREHLIKQARSILAPPPPAKPTDPPVSLETAPEASTEAAEESTAEQSIAEPTTVVEAVDPAKEVEASRARALLGALDVSESEES